jgi:DNA-binding MarR family transcriptional regulator
MNERTSNQAGPLMIGALVAIIDQELRSRVTEALHTSGFRDYRATYRSIFMWTRAEGSRITELAELAQVTQQSMSELVAELERRGYVERIPDPTDRRAMLVRRTERGWQVNVISRQAVAEVQASWEAQLGAAEYAQMLAALRHIVTLIAPPTTGVAGHPRTLAHGANQGEHNTSPDRPDKEPGEP